MTDVTVILNAIEQGSASTEELLPLVYDELRRLASARMKQEQPGQTLQATALVHEAFLKLLGSESTWENRRHFFAAAALVMQRILVDKARRKQRLKHGGDLQKAQLSDLDLLADDGADDDLLALDEALREFDRHDASKAELVRLRYFAGLSEEEAAKTLNISRATAARWWAYAKAWLFDKMRTQP